MGAPVNDGDRPLNPSSALSRSEIPAAHSGQSTTVTTGVVILEAMEHPPGFDSLADGSAGFAVLDPVRRLLEIWMAA